MCYLFFVSLLLFIAFPVQAQYFDYDQAFQNASEQADQYLWQDLLPSYFILLGSVAGGILLIKAFSRR